MGLISRVSSRTYRKRVMSKSDKVRNSRQKSQKTNNPFEQKHQNTKFNVLNRRQKHSKGTPGATKKKAFEHRKNTIGIDLKNLNKSNKFLDNRITAKDDLGRLYTNSRNLTRVDIVDTVRALEA